MNWKQPKWSDIYGTQHWTCGLAEMTSITPLEMSVDDAPIDLELWRGLKIHDAQLLLCFFCHPKFLAASESRASLSPTGFGWFQMSRRRRRNRRRNRSRRRRRNRGGEGGEEEGRGVLFRSAVRFDWWCRGLSSDLRGVPSRRSVHPYCAMPVMHADRQVMRTDNQIGDKKTDRQIDRGAVV